MASRRYLHLKRGMSVGAISRIMAKLKWTIRKRRVAKNCGCICYCPTCHDILNDRSEWTEDDPEIGKGSFLCSSCASRSEWIFGIAPVAILNQTTL